VLVAAAAQIVSQDKKMKLEWDSLSDNLNDEDEASELSS
jgi:hypothetical protein